MWKYPIVTIAHLEKLILMITWFQLYIQIMKSKGYGPLI